MKTEGTTKGLGKIVGKIIGIAWIGFWVLVLGAVAYLNGWHWKALALMPAVLAWVLVTADQLLAALREILDGPVKVWHLLIFGVFFCSIVAWIIERSLERERSRY